MSWAVEFEGSGPGDALVEADSAPKGLEGSSKLLDLLSLNAAAMLLKSRLASGAVSLLAVAVEVDDVAPGMLESVSSLSSSCRLVKP